MMTLTEPTHAEVLAAVAASGEFDSIDPICERGYSDSWHKCAQCGGFVEDDYDVDGASRSPELKKCSDCDDCAFHAGCAQDGKCPHCVTLDSLDVARDLVRICGLTLEQAFAQIATADRRLAGVRE